MKIRTNANFWRSWDRASWYISIVKPARSIIFRVYWTSLYMFRAVFPTIMRSSRLYILHDIHLMLYVQSWTPDDGRKNLPKHVEWYSINSKNCASSWFYYRNSLCVDHACSSVDRFVSLCSSIGDRIVCRIFMQICRLTSCLVYMALWQTYFPCRR